MQVDPTEYRYPLNKSIMNLYLERSGYLYMYLAREMLKTILVGGQKQNRPSVSHLETSKHSLGDARHGDNRATSQAPDKVSDCAVNAYRVCRYRGIFQRRRRS